MHLTSQRCFLNQALVVLKTAGDAALCSQLANAQPVIEIWGKENRRGKEREENDKREHDAEW